MSGPQTRQRSRNYPSISLQKAIELVKHLKNVEGANFTATRIALKHWKYSPKSSAGIRAIATLNQFRLLDEAGKGVERQIRVSQLATSILENPDSQGRKEAIRDAALQPALYRETWEQYNGDLPSDDNLRWELTGKGNPSKGVLTSKSVNEFIGAFRDTLEFAGLTGGGTIDQGDDEGEKEADSTPRAAHSSEASRDYIVENLPKPSARGSLMQSTFTPAQLGFNLPIPLGAGQQGNLILPSPMTAQQWERFLIAIESAKQLKTFLVEEPTQESEIESKDS